MDGFERRRLQKMDAILDAALELFKQYGYNKVSVSEIAEKASVSQVSIYNFFISKDNLKAVLIDKLWDEYYASMIGVVEGSGSVRFKLNRLFYTILDFVRKNSMGLLVDTIKMRMETERLNGDGQFKHLQQMTIGLVEQGKRDGAIRASISTQVVVSYLEIMRFYLVNSADVVTQFEGKPELLEALIDLFLDSIFI